MLIDITLKFTLEMLNAAQEIPNPELLGHWGTHFDAMDKEFPLEYTVRKGIVFDISLVQGREICAEDINIDEVEKDMFVAFYSGYIDKVPYAEKGYFSEHPVLSYTLIDALLDKGVSIIGLDFGGVRRGKEHTPTDQVCADRGTFVVENLVNLKTLLDNGGRFTAHTYPMNFVGMTGLPCRVIAEI